MAGMFNIGDRVSGYQILAGLRSGGMATLYLAHRVGPSGFTKPVAIKVIHQSLAEDDEFVRMFIDEALIASRIDHPNVVHVEEFGEVEGTYYLAMEYVHGCSVTQLMRRLIKQQRALPPELAVLIALQIADGLHAAHEMLDERGAPLEVVHRDVSPQNVLLAYAGHAKLIDFGIAKAVGQARATRTGGVRGKLQYMPPEQARGEPVDRRADVYALGVVLWEALAMRRLFSADNDAELLRRVRAPEVPSLAEFAPGLPAELYAVVAAALAPAREDRPGTARELRRALAGAMPSVLALDEGHVAAFLRDAMRDEIAPSEKLLEAAATRLHQPLQSAPRESSVRVIASASHADVATGDHAPTDVTPEASRTPRRPARTWARRGALGAVALAAAATALALALRPPGEAHVGPAPSGRPAATAPRAALASPPPPLPPSLAATATVHPEASAALEPSALPPRVHRAPRAGGTRAARPARADRGVHGLRVVEGVPIASDLSPRTEPARRPLR